MHGDIVADAEQGAAQRNKKQGAAGNTGSTAGANCSQNAEDASSNGVDDNAMVCAAAIAITVMVMAAPAMLMVAPAGWKQSKCPCEIPRRLHRLHVYGDVSGRAR